MKKNVVKAMSVGLSAITIASSLSVPVFAEESTEGGQPAEPSTASQEAETNVAEQTVVDDTAELDDTYNHGVDLPADEDAVATQIENVVDATNDAFSSDENYELEIEVVDGNGNVVEDADGNKETKTVTGNYQDTAKDIQDASDAAAMEIADAATDAELIKEAADEMDDAATDANTAVGNAESAAGEVTTAVNKAQQDANAAVVAVATDSQDNAAKLIATAQKSVADAQQTYNEKAKDLADAKSAYEDAKDALDTATEKYQDNISAAKIDLGYAETDLATLQAKVDELEKAVKQAETALAESAAGVLAKADEDYAKSGKSDDDKKEYIEAVVKNYYLEEVNKVQLAEGQKLEVTVSEAVENEDAGLNLVSVTYNVLDESGEVVATNSFNLGYAINNGVVELFEKEVRYECAIEENGEQKSVSYTEEEIKEEVKAGRAVKRYAYVDEQGATKYLSQDQYDLKTKDATDEEKAKYTFDYVIIGKWGEAETKNKDGNTKEVTIAGKTETVVEVEEVATGEDATTVTYFDDFGNYIKVITNYTTKHVYTYKNGERISEDSFKDKASAEAAVESALANLTNVFMSAKSVSDYYKLSGSYIPVYEYSGSKTEDSTEYILLVPNTYHKELKEAIRIAKENTESAIINQYTDGYYGVVLTIDKDGAVITTDSTKMGWGITWTEYKADATMNYTATYSKEYTGETGYNFFQWLADFFVGGKIEKSKLEQFEKDHNVKVVFGEPIDGKFTKETVYFLQKYDFEDNTKYATEDAARNAANDAAKNAAIANKSGLADGEKIIAIRTDLTSDTYKYNHEYQYTLDYITRTDAIDATGNNYTVESQTAILGYLKDVFRNVPNATDLVSGYTTQISGTNTTLSNYQTLLDQLAAAKTAVEAAQDKVTDIQGKIDDLNKDGAILSLQVLEWELRLADAQKAYDDAKATLDDAKAALNTATQAYSDKYPTIVPTTGGGATTIIGGGAAPVVYATATTAAVAADEELVIPDDAVPAAGQTRARRARTVAANDNTTTIDEAETPLAGGDADDAVVEDTQDETTTVEEDSVPLAGEAQKGFFARTWWGWLLLIIAVLTGSAAYAKKKANAKKIK